METNQTKSTRSRWFALLAMPIFLLLAGCDVKVIDLTPSVMKANPSGIYTVRAQISIKNSAVVDETLRPEVIIDGKAHPMVLAPGSSTLYEYDFKMPAGRNSASYYVLVRYVRKTAGGKGNKEVYSELGKFSVEGRYMVELEVDRAPVGTRVGILGRGFTPDDKVIVGGAPASARWDSSNSLSFYVPSLPEGRNYQVKVLGPNGEIDAGILRIDASQISVTPGSINIASGQSTGLVFRIPEPAPPGGLRISVTTDVPNSVIMDYVVIQAGQQTESIQVKGGAPGSGSLFVEVPGYSEVVVPITVR